MNVSVTMIFEYHHNVNELIEQENNEINNGMKIETEECIKHLQEKSQMI